jgi:lipopolysaccharide transport system ATP-binding protein
MANIAIKAENISKQYRLGEVGTGTLTHDLNRLWHKLRGKENPYLKIGDVNDRSIKGESDYVWSLRDINFEINTGDAVGIIGRNGSGKSTLLKLLSKVSRPTTGNFKVNGRIASLLEVGTGFNPNLTGKENVYLNGAILGMNRQEITRKFDEIVDFSGVERYINTPVKRYSSGMYVRLAFAVAAHLESEILIVDEVLAVGDAEFQRKCIGKMGDVSKGEGRTVLFVSHNTAAVKSLCSNGILLNKGAVEHRGDIDSCVSLYFGGGNKSVPNAKFFKDIFLNGVFNLEQISICADGKSNSDILVETDALKLTTTINILSNEPQRYHLTYLIYSEIGDPLFTFSSKNNVPLHQGLNNLSCIFPSEFLQSGSYYLSLYVVIDKRASVFVEREIFHFNIVDRVRDLGVFMGREPGYIRPKFNWKNDLL